MLKWVVGRDRRMEAEKNRGRMGSVTYPPHFVRGTYQPAIADPIIGFEAFPHLTDEAWIGSWHL